MEQPIVFTARLRPERWYRRPSVWLAVALAAVCVAVVASRAGSPVAGMSLGAVAAASAIGAVVIVVRRHRAARAEIVAMIDENLALRDADPRHQTERDAAARAAILAMRDRLSRSL